MSEDPETDGVSGSGAPPRITPAEGAAAVARSGRLERLLATTIAAANDAFVTVDDRGAILEWNRQAEHLLGWRRDEVLGRQLVLIPPSSKPPSSTSTPGDVSELLSHAGRSDRPVRMVVPAKSRDEDVFSVEVTMWSTPGSHGPMFHAFLRRTAASVPIPEDARTCRVGSIVESSDAAIIGEDLAGRVVTWNRAAEQVYGFSSSEMLGRPSLVIVPVEHRAEVRRLVGRAARGRQVPSHETVRLGIDGSIIEVAVTISPVHDQSGEIIGVSTIARDITEQRRVAVALEAALLEAREAEARSRRFLADVAHQLRNPIAGIRACADTLLRGAAPADHEQLLALVVDEASRANRLMNALLRMARLDQGETPNPAPVDVVTLCRTEVERVRVLAPELEVDVRVADLRVRTPLLDADVVAEIIGNLLDNARRHARRSVELVVASAPEAVEVRVIDDGPGLLPELVDRAFERFASLDGEGGSGLGLSIARGLARSHGGDLRWKHGAFVLTLGPVPAGAVADREAGGQTPSGGRPDEQGDQSAPGRHPLRRRHSA